MKNNLSDLNDLKKSEEVEQELLQNESAEDNINSTRDDYIRYCANTYIKGNHYSRNNANNSYVSNNIIEYMKHHFKVLALIIFLLLTYLVFLNVTTSKENVNNIFQESSGNIILSAPTQTKKSGETSVSILSTDVLLTHVANYTIRGRVVATYTYLNSNSTKLYKNIKNTLMIKDVGLCWGFLADDEVNKHITWSNSGDRFLRWSASKEWADSIGGSSAMQANLSNNHLIPSNETATTNILKIRTGDFIQISGILVNISFTADNVKYTSKTSTSRTDRGAGACEIIYVTDVTWLK